MKSKYILLVFSALFCLNLQAQTHSPLVFGADPIWEKNGNQNPSFMGQDATRSIAFAVRGGQKKLYVVSRHEAPNVYVLNAETGTYNPATDVLAYDELVVKGGHFVLSAVGITEDNVVVACSMSSNLSGAVQRIFRAYAWDTDAGEARLLLNVDNIVEMSGGLANTRIGDKLTVTGRLDNGTAKLYLPNYSLQSTPGNDLPHPTMYVFSMESNGAGGFRFKATPTLVDIPITDIASISNASVTVLSDGSYFWSALGSAIYFINSRGELIGRSDGGVVGVQDAAIKYLCKVGRIEYLAFCRSDFRCAEILKVVDGNIAGIQIAGYTPPMADGGAFVNGNGTGDIAVDTSTPNPTLFVLCTNQGLGAYKTTAIAQRDMTDNVEVLWEFPNLLDKAYPELPDFLYLGATVENTDVYSTRDIALATRDGRKILYIVNAYNPETSDPTTERLFGIYAVDALTGETITNEEGWPLSLKLPADDVLNQGSERIWSATATKDNILLVANAASSGKKFQVYAYSGPMEEPLLALSYTVPAGVDLGTYGKVSVIGNFYDKTAKLYVTDNTLSGDDAAGTVTAKVYIFSMQQSEFAFDTNPTVITFNPGRSTTGGRLWFQNLCVSALEDGSFLWDDTFFPLCHVSLQGTVLSTVDTDLVPSVANVGRYVGANTQGKAYAAYYEYRSGKAEIYEYPQSNLSGAGRAVVAKTNSFANRSLFVWPNYEAGSYYYKFPQSLEASGGVVVDIESNGKPVIYLMSQNRGLGAYRINGITIGEGVSIPQVNTVSQRATVYQRGSILEIKGVGVQSLEIYSVAGQRIAESRGQSEISVAGLQGVLLVKIKATDGKTEVHKLIVK